MAQQHLYTGEKNTAVQKANLIAELNKWCYIPSVAHENVDYGIANYEWRTRHGTDLLNSWG